MRRTRFTRFCARSCALIAWLAVGACSSVPTHFYTLMHPAGPGAPAPAPFAIAVLPVGIPAQADQPQLVVRTGTGSVAVLDNERWVAPLADEIRAALADDLERSLGARDVRGQAHREGQAVYRVQLDVRRFESVPADHALIEADWNVRRGDDLAAACSSRATATVGPGYEALVEGHQRALAQVAAQITETIRAAAAGDPARCPR